MARLIIGGSGWLPLMGRLALAVSLINNRF